MGAHNSCQIQESKQHLRGAGKQPGCHIPLAGVALTIVVSALPPLSHGIVDALKVVTALKELLGHLKLDIFVRKGPEILVLACALERWRCSFLAHLCELVADSLCGHADRI